MRFEKNAIVFVQQPVVGVWRAVLVSKELERAIFAGSFTFVVGNAPPRAIAVPPPATKEREMRGRTDALKESTCLSARCDLSSVVIVILPTRVNPSIDCN